MKIMKPFVWKMHDASGLWAKVDGVICHPKISRSPQTGVFRITLIFKQSFSLQVIVEGQDEVQ